jgi:hypothetical protein
MSWKRLIIYSGAAVAVVCVMLLAALWLLVPRLIDPESVKARLESEISKSVEFDLGFKDARLVFFPRPHMEITAPAFKLPGRLKGSAGSILVYPRILPLLTGNVRVSRVALRAPEVGVELPGITPGIEEKLKRLSAKKISDAFARILAPLTPPAPLAAVLKEIEVELIGGNVELLRDSRPVFSFHDLHAELFFPAGGLRVKLEGGSNLFERISFRGEAGTGRGEFRPNGRVKIKKLDPGPLLRFFSPEYARRVTPSAMDLDVSIEPTGEGVGGETGGIRVEASGPLADITLHADGEDFLMEGREFRGGIVIEDEKTTLFVTGLDLTSPKLSVTGNLSVYPEESLLEIDSAGVELSSVRAAAMVLANENPGVKKTFTVVRGGRLPGISVRARARSIADFFEKGNYLVNLSMRGGKIHIPKVNLDFDEVNGEMVISEDILLGQKLEGRMRGSRGVDTELRIGITDEEETLHIETNVDSDLAELPDTLRLLVKNKALLKEVDLISTISGRARGRLVVGESTRDPEVRIDISDFSAMAGYERVPHAIEVTRGGFHYGPDGIMLKGLNGTVGKSSFSGITAGLRLGKTPYFDKLTGGATISTNELYPVITKITGPELLSKHIRATSGLLKFSSMEVTGPILRPGEWVFDLKGEFDDFFLDAAFLPAPVKMRSGGFEATPTRLKIDKARADILDAQLNVSAGFSGYLEGFAKLAQGSLTISGDMGPEAAGRFHEAAGLPKGLELRAPSSLSKADIKWDRSGRMEFDASLSLREGTELSIDMSRSQDVLVIRKLDIRDGTSRASIGLVLKGDTLGVSFAGRLTEETLDGLLYTNTILKGWVEGDFSADFRAGPKGRFIAQGRLKGENVFLPMPAGSPVKLINFSVHGEEGNVMVDPMVFTWMEYLYTLTGDFSATKDTLLIDMDLSTDGIMLEETLKALGTDREKKGAEKERFVRIPPFKGNLRVRSKTLTFKGFTWRPFDADILFSPGRKVVTVSRAELCGISTPGSVEVTSGLIRLDFKPTAANRDFPPTMACLFDKGDLITGKFSLDSTITAQGGSDELAKKIAGNWALKADEGRIYRLEALAKLLAVLNVTEILRGEVPDIMESGFAYRTISAKGGVEGERVIISEGFLDGPSMELAGEGEVNLKDKTIDMKVLFAPLKTADFIIKQIPIVEEILGGTLVSIPVRVKGDIKDPKITYLSPGDIGSGLVEIMKRTLQAPFKIIEPVINGEKKPDKQKAE